MEGPLLPSELLELVRLSMKATALDAYTANDGETFDPRNPALRKLVEAVLYSRKFVLTYYAVVAVLLLGYTTVRFSRRLQSRSRRKDSGTTTPASYASTSSTLREDGQVERDVNPERKPLLSNALRDGGALGTERHSILNTLRSRVQSIWMYQPRPIFAVTSPINVLPANSTTCAVLLILATNIFYLLYNTTLSIPMLFAFADRAGLCFAMNLPILYLLAAKSNQPIQLLTGMSYEGLNIFHRRLGEWMTALAAMHSVGMIGVWYTLLRPFHFTFLRFVSGRVGLLGIFTFVSYLAIYVSSIGWVRKLFYERFLLLHVVLQVAALVFLFFHHSDSRPYVLASLAVWALDRIVIRNALAPKRYIATLEIASDKKTVLLHCTIPIMSERWGFRRSISSGWKASQHVFVTIPGTGYVQHRLQTHPFTIASHAPPTHHVGPWQLQLIIRAQDGFSKQLLEYAEFHQHTEVLIDGPYGSTDTLDTMHKADRVCLIAGGSGIAVTYPLAWSLNVLPVADAALSRRTIYDQGRRMLPQILNELQALEGKHSHIWVRQDTRADDWISYIPKATATKLSPFQQRSPIPTGSEHQAADLVTQRFLTGGVHAFRPDLAVELRDWIEAEADDTMKGSLTTRASKHLIIVSGPDSLVRSVRNGAAMLVRQGYDIEVHVEKFGW